MLVAMIFTAWGTDCFSLHHAKIKQMDRDIII